MKVYGPYTRRDGRKHVIIVDDAGIRRTQSYPRFLLEDRLGYSLPKELTVDHVNNDKTDDRISNYELLTRAANAAKSIRNRKAK